MGGPLIPKKLREEYEELASEYRKYQNLEPRSAQDWKEVLRLQKALADVYLRAYRALDDRDPMVGMAMQWAHRWYEEAASKSEKIVGAFAP